MSCVVDNMCKIISSLELSSSDEEEAEPKKLSIYLNPTVSNNNSQKTIQSIKILVSVRLHEAITPNPPAIGTVFMLRLVGNRGYSLGVYEEDEGSMEIVTQDPFHLKLVGLKPK
ncbi:unnamed protein product [Lactuca saligna]|uniref:Uncharacterized protein n=1 Tax=Lactuca saligna TaxID=75948 RepID=A0AA36DZL4_LACSI|nr:unnamed protein product [Lactuca saligna]